MTSLATMLMYNADAIPGQLKTMAKLVKLVKLFFSFFSFDVAASAQRCVFCPHNRRGGLEQEPGIACVHTTGRLRKSRRKKKQLRLEPAGLLKV